NQNSEQEKQDQQNQNSEQEKQGEQQKQSDSTGDDKKKQPQPNQGQEQRDAGQVKPNGKMTPEQVRQLLDTLKQQERSLIYRPVQKGKANKRGIIKNW
ncbi:MAG: hypothetical protein VX704_02950, partial [Verrucomicrobiota bacterium]|nr:hypothetical protein [Verrucomicrobiota bacterium]